jgi:synaptosomal-associated protein 29
MSNNRYQTETVDDAQFLSHPRAGSGYILSNQYNQLNSHNQPPSQPRPPSQQTNNSLEQQRQALIQRRREVEDRTLASSEVSLGLLYESEKVGTETAVELSRQKEQLLNTESKLDEINSSLRQSERHIQGIRSVFGSIRNYFSGHSNSAQASAPAPAPAPAGPGNRNLSSSASTGSSFNNLNNRVTQSHSAVDQISTQNYNAVDERLDRNLDDMASSLARLKGLAQGLNTELDDHDQIIGRVHDKAEVVGFKVDKQNRDMGRILKK